MPHELPGEFNSRIMNQKLQNTFKGVEPMTKIPVKCLCDTPAPEKQWEERFNQMIVEAGFEDTLEAKRKIWLDFIRQEKEQSYKEGLKDGSEYESSDCQMHKEKARFSLLSEIEKEVESLKYGLKHFNSMILQAEYHNYAIAKVLQILEKYKEE